jgi:hypothetical protein
VKEVQKRSSLLLLSSHVNNIIRRQKQNERNDRGKEAKKIHSHDSGRCKKITEMIQK